MRVSLIGEMKFAKWAVGYDRDYAHHESDIETLMAGVMNRCVKDSSFSNVVDRASPKKVVERVQKSVKDQHGTVAGFSEFIFDIEGISRACSHQLVRHRTAWFLQQSQRYVNPVRKKDWYVIPPEIKESVTLLELYKDTMGKAKARYLELIKHGIEKEDARFILPNACKTNIFMKIDGKNLIHFLKLRLDSHAQWEINELAQKMYKLAHEVAPNLFDPDLEEYWW
jgi:thymidylate synthase (FAD)